MEIAIQTLETLKAKTKENPTTGCWEWQKSLSKEGGYGGVRHNKTRWKAHRLAYFLVHGEIPKRRVLCHTCDNPPCINPEHLFPGTQKDNTKDAIQKHRHSFRTNFIHKKGEDHIHAKLTERKVRRIRFLRGIKHLQLSQLAEMFNISIKTISRIVNRTAWNHI